MGVVTWGKPEGIHRMGRELHQGESNFYCGERNGI